MFVCFFVFLYSMPLNVFVKNSPCVWFINQIACVLPNFNRLFRTFVLWIRGFKNSGMLNVVECQLGLDFVV
jgi:hypothetical protein